MNIGVLQQRAGKFVADHASTILTVGGVVGTGLTAVLTARATFKAGEILREDMAIRQEAVREKQDPESDHWEFAADHTRTEQVKLVWKQYVPPVVVGVATIASIIGANQMSAKRAAALAAAYGISEDRFREYKKKVEEKLGIKKEQDLRDQIAQERVTKNPPGDKEVILIGSGDVLCMDSYTGRYFQSTVDAIKKAELKVNHDIFHYGHASLSSFYDEVGLPPTGYTDEVGWNSHFLVDVSLSTTMSPNGQPCIVVDFKEAPRPDYAKVYD